MKKQWIIFTALVLTAFSIISVLFWTVKIKAQKKEAQINTQKDKNQTKDKKDGLSCADHQDNIGIISQCEIREQTLPSTAEAISVDGLQHGEIAIKGWDRNDIFLRARIKAGAKSAVKARELINQVKIETSGMKIQAAVPPSLQDDDWNVSYEIFVPRESTLSLQTHDGGISIDNVRGRIDFKTFNGGANLTGLGGNVRGDVTNGGIYILLTGDSWNGKGMNVATKNGGVYMYLPENYSAHLITGSLNGPLDIKFPLNTPTQNQSVNMLSADVGVGGATVRAISANGGVLIRRP